MGPNPPRGSNRDPLDSSANPDQTAVCIVRRSDDGTAFLLTEAPETPIPRSMYEATPHADPETMRRWVFVWDRSVAALVSPFMAYQRQLMMLPKRQVGVDRALMFCACANDRNACSRS
jgi:hypothetical protein